jgi:hypothetical protein
LQYNDDPATKELVFEKVLEFFRKRHVYCGESVMQNDDIALDAPEFFSMLANDVFKFEILSEN